MRPLRPRSPWLALLALAPLLTACTSPTPAAPVDEARVAEGLNDQFLNPEADVSRWVNMFESENRNIARFAGEIVDAARAEPGMDVADIGCGTGLFVPHFLEAIGADGDYYAVDISPAMLELLGQRKAESDWDQVTVVECDEKSSKLEPRSVDLVFICDTYHHFEFPLHTMESIHRAIRPGGRLVIVDFDRIPGVSRDWLLDHVRAGKEVFRAEIESAGFVFDHEPEMENLSENYLLVFRRP